MDTLSLKDILIYSVNDLLKKYNVMLKDVKNLEVAITIYVKDFLIEKFPLKEHLMIIFFKLHYNVIMTV